MTINKEVKTVILVILVTGIALAVLMPRKKGGPAKPKEADKDAAATKTNASIILNAYMDAKLANEDAEQMEKLNQIFVDRYGMRVHETAPGQFVARTISGTDILVGKNSSIK
jgi:hypothetical protein